MIPVFHFADQMVVILGLGRSGLWAAKALMAGGAKVIAWDDTPAIREAAIEQGLHVQEPSGHNWAHAAALILSPGIPTHLPRPHSYVDLARRHNVPLMMDIDLLFLAQPHASYIGITGTNGKSTVTALVYHVLKETGYIVQTGGNNGIPALSLDPLGQTGVYVLEVSSYQLEIMSKMHFQAAAFLNISADHLKRHGTMAKYVAAKQRIFLHQDREDCAVVSVDDPYSYKVCHMLQAQGSQSVIPISATQVLKQGIFWKGAGITEITKAKCKQDIRIDPTFSLPPANVVAAYGLIRHFGISGEDFKKALSTFKSLPHRQETVAIIDGVAYINDSKATNMPAAEAALAKHKNIIWILGGRHKAEPLTTLTPYFGHIKAAFVIGEAAEEFAIILEQAGVAVTQAGTLDKAVHQAQSLAANLKAQHPVVLLSPCCESFDQFDNFEHRGDMFRALVKELPGHHQSLGQEVV